MKLTCAFVFAIVLAGPPASMGQATAHSNRAAAAPAGLSVEDVIKLAKAGLSEEIILQQIKKKNRPFDLATDQLIALKTANVSDRIVAFMLDPSKPEIPASTPAEPPATLAPARAQQPVEARAVAPAVATLVPVETESALPREVGVYARKQNQWVEVAPEIVYWKTGGALKTIATAGVLHGDVNGRVPGVSAHNTFATPLELLIVAPEGVVMAEYQLLRLRPNKDSREFRSVTGGVLHSQSGAFRDIITFDSKKLANRAYQATFPSSAGPANTVCCRRDRTTARERSILSALWNQPRTEGSVMRRTLFGVFLMAAVAFARMTVEDVLRLAQAGVSEAIILEQIRSQHQIFDLAADQLIELKQAHVSERVMAAMMAPTTPETVSHPAAAASRPVAPAAAVSRPPAVPAAFAAAPITPVKWARHSDPTGFSVNLPAGWDLLADRSAGRITVQGLHGEKAIIWPMFIERQQLDQRGAAELLKQLATRADPELVWGAPEIVGGDARVLARGTSNGASIIHWNALPDGTVVYLFCVTAPASLYRGSLDVFTGILKSFHVTPAADTAATAANSPARTVLKWTRWNDPHEGAFGVSIPQGWSINGGSIRHSPTDIRESVVVLAPDGQVRITVGDDNISAYAEPHAMYASARLREGRYTSLGDGTKLQIRRFTPAAQFVREYLSGPALRDCSGLYVISEEQRPDLAAASEEQARAHGVRNMRITTSGVSFSCTWNGRPARGYYAAATAFVPSQMGGIWYVDPLYGYVATSERQSEADKISRHVVESMQVNSDWKRKEDQMAADAVRSDNERAAEIQAAARKSIAENQRATSDMIVKGYEARSRVYDEISRKRENAILGTVDVVDPNTGRQYKVDNYSDYHWMNNQGVAGTKTDTSPGMDWRQMITLP